MSTYLRRIIQITILEYIRLGNMNKEMILQTNADRIRSPFLSNVSFVYKLKK